VLHYTGILQFLPLSYQIDLSQDVNQPPDSGTDGIVWRSLIAISKRMVNTLMAKQSIFV